MNISFEVVLDIATIASIAISAIMTWKTSSKQNKHEKEMLEMKHNFEISMRNFQENKEQRDNYELQRIAAIQNYGDGVGAILSDEDDPESYAKFERSISAIFMYTPSDIHSQIEELNDVLLQIQKIDVWPGDDGYNRQKRNALKNKANELYHQLCQSFSELIVHPPLSIEKHQ